MSESQKGTWRAKPASREVSASILRWCFRDRKQGRRCWRYFKSARKAIRQQEITFETEKLRICQNSKMFKTEKYYKLGPKICTPPILGRQNPSNPRLWQTVRVTSKLFMDPTNIIASDPQVWLLALKWHFSTFCHLLLNFLSCLFYDTLDDH